MKVRTINTFSGGVAKDIREPRTNTFSYASGFDTFSNAHKLSPYRTMETESVDSGTLANFVMTDVVIMKDATGTQLYALGQVGAADTNTKFFQKASAMDISASFQALTNGEDTTNNVIACTLQSYNQRLYALKTDNTNTFLVEYNRQTTTLTTKADGGATTTLTGVATNVKPFVHPMDDILYIGHSNWISKQEKGAVTQRLDGTLQNLTAFTNYSQDLQTKARIKGSASEAQLGTNPTSGTPFALQNLVVQQGQGIHEYRQGKIATFFADQLYRDWILQMMVDDLNQGKNFSEELTLDELQEVAQIISNNQAEIKMREMILNGEVITPELKNEVVALFKEKFVKEHGKRAFFEVIKGELSEIPMNVLVNVAGKQRNMAKNADAITNILREVLKNPQAFQQIPGVGKVFNQLLEESGMSAIDFTEITTPALPPQEASQSVGVTS